MVDACLRTFGAGGSWENKTPSRGWGLYASAPSALSRIMIADFCLLDSALRLLKSVVADDPFFAVFEAPEFGAG